MQKLQTVDKNHIKYTELPGGISSWQNANEYRPYAFDLVEIATDKGIRAGWWTGNDWYGMKLRKEDKIISWKKSRELDFI